ncbi:MULTISPECIES: glucose 1-dehydrogenase [unclassified Bradyrhizobium]|uniref:SDR family NAD(P)-dependent oxidoreductase n=1 Tax=unclassified Bradyrhizobium TaxID=2631580 RepID=UPI0028E5E6A2|nr:MULTISPECIES: glucose 1-dehydrogenase [unclassified Bradyrhizobium]
MTDTPLTADARSPKASCMQGQVCLVTGGGSGIGRATAVKLAAEGAQAVVVAGRREAALADTAARCRSLGAEALVVKADVTQEADVVHLVRSVMDRYGRLDAAFNNAGFQERRAPIEQQGDGVYADVFDGNVRSVFLCLRAQLPIMYARGHGRIVINASVSGVRNPNVGLALYSASKAAVISLTRSAALEAAPRGVRINAIAPGRVVTDMMLRAGVGDIATVAAGLPLRRMGQPDDIAEAVLWLLSDASSYVVGHVLAADGGFLAS